VVVLKQIGQHWSLFLVRGIFALLLGVFILAWPGPARFALIVAFSIYALGDGIGALVYSFWPNVGDRWLLAIEGMVGVVVGASVLRTSAARPSSLYLLIAAWAIIVGILQIIHGMRAREEGLALTSAVVQILLGVVILALQHRSATIVLWLVAIYAFIRGVIEIAEALRIHQRSHELPTTAVPQH
jgi:uncharacterized membrane protein HdeD (DUF308 family)